MSTTAPANPSLIRPPRALPGWVGLYGARDAAIGIGFYLKRELTELKLVIVDDDAGALDRVVTGINACTSAAVDAGVLVRERAERIRCNLLPATEYEALAFCDWVIDLSGGGRAACETIERFTRPEAVITSTVGHAPADLFRVMAHPGRCTVTRFFPPEQDNPAVELVDWDGLDAEVFQYLRWLLDATGKIPLVSADRLPLMLERFHGVSAGAEETMSGALFTEAAAIVGEGAASAADLELGSRLALGLERGPLERMRAAGAESARQIVADYTGGDSREAGVDACMSAHTEVLLDRVDGIVVISIRRPDRDNIIDARAAAEIAESLDAHEQDARTTGFVITACGSGSLSGAPELEIFRELLGSRERAREYTRERSGLLRRIDLCRKPVIAALNGATCGTGLQLALRCHGIVASHSAWLQFPEIKYGVAPGLGAMVIPYRRWPEASRLFHAMLTRAERVGADNACAAGIVDTLVREGAHLVPAAMWLAREMSGTEERYRPGPVSIAPVITEVNHPSSTDGQRLSPAVLAIMREAIQAAAATSLEEGLQHGDRAFAESLCTPAAREGIEACLSGRAPDFRLTG